MQLDVLAKYGQWCVTHPVISYPGRPTEPVVIEDAFRVTHAPTGHCITQATSCDKGLAVAVARALKPYEFLSLQDPVWKRDRDEMEQVVSRTVAGYFAQKEDLLEVSR
jgi:hypothetical protein